MNRADQTLETELQQAFAAGEFARLARFAWWCAAETAIPSMPDDWRRALELAWRRAEGECDERMFPGEADAVLRDLPLAATVIGLRRGAPNAMRLLTIAAALDPGPLSAAVRASRNHRAYERLVAQRLLAQDDLGEGAVVVDIRTARPLTDEGAPPSVAEAKCAARQLAAWIGGTLPFTPHAMSDPGHKG